MHGTTIPAFDGFVFILDLPSRCSRQRAGARIRLPPVRAQIEARVKMDVCPVIAAAAPFVPPVVPFTMAATRHGPGEVPPSCPTPPRTSPRTSRSRRITLGQRSCPQGAIDISPGRKPWVRQSSRHDAPMVRQNQASIPKYELPQSFAAKLVEFVPADGEKESYWRTGKHEPMRIPMPDKLPM